MRKQLRNTSFIACLAIACALICACQKNDMGKVEEITANKIPAEVSTGVEAIYSDSGHVTAKLTAPKMIRTLTGDPTVEMPDGLKVLFYDKDLAVKSSLRADHGIRYLKRDLTKVTGDVQVVNEDGDTLRTEEMFWDEAKERIYSQKFTTVKTEEEKIIAEGFESDLHFTNIQFYKVKGRIPAK